MVDKQRTRKATLNDTVMMAGKLQNELRKMRHILHTEQYIIGEGRRIDGIGITIHPRESISFIELENKITEAMKDHFIWVTNVEMVIDKDIYGFGPDCKRRLLVRLKKKRDS